MEGELLEDLFSVDRCEVRLIGVHLRHRKLSFLFSRQFRVLFDSCACGLDAFFPCRALYLLESGEETDGAWGLLE